MKVNIDDLPSLPLEERSQLPPVPAIYFAIDSLGQVQYIGRSINLQQRWISHHQTRHLDGARIAWMLVDSIELLPEIEKALVQWFNPPTQRWQENKKLARTITRTEEAANSRRSKQDGDIRIDREELGERAHYTDLAPRPV
jgi:hypothetical protein